MNGYHLTDLSGTTGALPRTLHGLATRSPLRFPRHVVGVGAELAVAAVLNRLAPERGGSIEAAPGEAQARGASLVLYLHWSPDGRISAVVRRRSRCGGTAASMWCSWRGADPAPSAIP